MKNTVERSNMDKASETAARLRKKYGFELTAKASKPLPKSAYDEMWEDRDRHHRVGTPKKQKGPF